MSVRAAKPRVAIVGGGIAGVTAAWQLARLNVADVTLFEASTRLGGTVETVHRDGFTIECGPDGWVSEKPWAQELAGELGLASELILSNDADRVTYTVHGGDLLAMPDGMRMMVPTNFAALKGSPLFSDEARTAYAAEPARAAELRRTLPTQDESVAEFVLRHFGAEVLTKIAAPLLSGVFGGDVAKLSVRAVMPAFVTMEREYGSLILALQARVGRPVQAIFTSLNCGLESLVERMVAEIPESWLRLSTPVSAITKDDGWTISSGGKQERFDALLLAVPAHVARALLMPFDEHMARLLEMEATSAVVAALAFDESFPLPAGFGFLVPAGERSELLACTFTDQKYPGRAPTSKRLLRAFFGAEAAPRIAAMRDDHIAALAHADLSRILGKLPPPAFHVVRRWPQGLPQYAVGHVERMAELDARRRKHTGLWLLGNAYRGVGLPDLVRDGRSAAHEVVGS